MEHEYWNLKIETANEENDFVLIATLGLKPFIDGNRWCVLWGENIQSGICGFGSTVHRAVLNFNSNVYTSKIKGNKK